jgi:hypothetical protein
MYSASVASSDSRDTGDAGALAGGREELGCGIWADLAW